jgi:putative membrane protein
MYLYLKSLHLIFVVTWFAGLFYIVRLFIYHTEALKKPEPERGILDRQLSKMSRLLWNVITWPSALLTLAFGSSLIISQPDWLKLPFMHVKLGFVFFLYIYHFSCHYIYKKLQRGEIKFSSFQLRIWNEVATLFLVAIIFLIILKSEVNWIWGTLGFIGFGIFLMVIVKLYKVIRDKSKR